MSALTANRQARPQAVCCPRLAAGIAMPVGAYFASPSVRAAVDALGIHRLTLLHIGRLPAALVFFCYSQRNELPALFWLLAGVGGPDGGSVRSHDALASANRQQLSGSASVRLCRLCGRGCPRFDLCAAARSPHGPADHAADGADPVVWRGSFRSTGGPSVQQRDMRFLAVRQSGTVERPARLLDVVAVRHSDQPGQRHARAWPQRIGGRQALCGSSRRKKLFIVTGVSLHGVPALCGRGFHCRAPRGGSTGTPMACWRARRPSKPVQAASTASPRRRHAGSARFGHRAPPGRQVAQSQRCRKVGLDFLSSAISRRDDSGELPTAVDQTAAVHGCPGPAIVESSP